MSKLTECWRFIRGTWVPPRLAQADAADLRVLRIVLTAALTALVTLAAELVMLTLRITTGDSAYETAYHVLYLVTWLPMIIMFGCGLYQLSRHR
jgi:hypothetical protein